MQISFLNPRVQKFTRMFLFGLMIQLVNNVMPHTNKARPQGLIIVEDGMGIFSKYLFDTSIEISDPRREEADKMLSEFVYFKDVSLGSVFEKWIGRELTYRNVSVVTLTRSIAEIFESIARFAELVILFRLVKTDRNNYKYRADIKNNSIIIIRFALRFIDDHQYETTKYYRS